MHSPRLFSYILTHDYGFSPNPFFGGCTLACCKPKIRLSAQPGDWIVGLSPGGKDKRNVYAMHVDEKMTFADYWRDAPYQSAKHLARAGEASASFKHNRECTLKDTSASPARKSRISGR